ncbi:MAG: sugar ABC transporter ATP-binding protein [Peptococcaceae bacterium]|jgi:simple sugar transport system ATP-binding protein|nr:sugar ABC transporter ATP-binding protein [Peptococcaceae bacterium]
MPAEAPLLQFDGIGKVFDGNRVLQDVSLTLDKGQVLGLVGENGAGKSTMMKILFMMPEISQTGGYEGRVLLEGDEVKFKGPMDALSAGIGMVHQEFSLIPGFTVAENISLNIEKTKRNVVSAVLGKRLETVDFSFINQKAQKSVESLGVKIDVTKAVSDMPVGYKQFIEIAREIDRDQIKLLVLDEPTAVLTESEAEILLQAINRMKDIGVGIIFISHRLGEVMSICDKVAVLRDGELVAEKQMEEVDLNQIVMWMVGREVGASSRKPDRAGGGDANIMEIRDLWVDMPGEAVRSVSLEIKRGEILGIGGLAGQGKLGIPNGIMGLMPSGGEVIFNGAPLKSGYAADALRRGLAFVSEDRRGVGLLLDEPIYWNITFSAMQAQEKFLHILPGGLVKLRNESLMKKTAKEYIDLLKIRCVSEKQKVRQLSGGNQQKVCLARAFVMQPTMLFVSEPTRGIDVGAKKLVLDALQRYNEENGTTIVIVSSELEELRSICDRIAVICEGEVSGILPASADAVEFGLLMSGLKAPKAPKALKEEAVYG